MRSKDPTRDKDPSLGSGEEPANSRSLAKQLAVDIREQRALPPSFATPPYRQHLAWVLGVVAALLIACIEVAILAVPERSTTVGPKAEVRVQVP